MVQITPQLLSLLCSGSSASHKSVLAPSKEDTSFFTIYVSRSTICVVLVCSMSKGSRSIFLE
jgi:hypothetical protein